MRVHMTLPDYITVSNGILGFAAITYIVDGRYMISSMLLIVCILLDGLDGALARRTGKVHSGGAELDYFADIISFCMAPAILLYSNYYDPGLGRGWESPLNASVMAISTLIVILGILRLGRHMKEGMNDPHFAGIPSPALALVVVLMTALYGTEGVLGYEPVPVIALISVLSCLMYSRIPYPKPRGKIFMTGGALFLALALGGLVLAKNSYPMGTLLLLISTVASLCYIVIGPLVVIKNDGKHGRRSG